MHRSHKDKRRWCKGKVGRPHEPAIRINRHMAMATGGRGRHPCSWSVWFARGIHAGLHWSCVHERHCTVCGKILEPWVAFEDCPDRHDQPAEPLPDLLCSGPNGCGHKLEDHLPFTGCQACACRHFWWEDPNAKREQR